MGNQNRWKYIGIGAIGIPVAIILLVYFQNRSLFLDSLNLARNVGGLSFAELAQPLFYNQSAPLLFLWLSKLFTVPFGMSEYILRFLPLISSFAALFLLFRFGSLFLSNKWKFVAVFWMGTHSLFIRYATEYKQYMTDVLSTMIVFWLIDKYKRIDKTNWIPIFIVGTLLMWFSMPVVFVLGGFLAYSLPRSKAEKASLIPTVGVALLYGVSFLIQYVYFYSPVMENIQMKNFHEEFFLKSDFWNMESLVHDFNLKISYLRMLVGKSGVAIGSAVILIWTSLYRSILKRDSKILVLYIPIFLMFIASMIGKYSLIERLMLFSFPLLIILVLQGLSFYWDSSSQSVKRYLGYILSLGLLVGFVQKQGVAYAIEPLEIEDNLGPLVFIANHPDSKRQIITTHNAFPAFDYYLNHKKSFDKEKIGKGIVTHYNTDMEGMFRIQLQKEGAIWIFAAHENDKKIDELKSKFSKYGRLVTEYKSEQSAAILYERK